ncbi:MAG: tetratricopeptide repeat protein [Candidatus Krumholzibacteria bacterium]|nr:tetratricopeptide repeat protein [Candidatus Krumholzibacteria bacterium]
MGIDTISFKAILLVILCIAAVILLVMLFLQKKRKRRTSGTGYIEALYALIDGDRDKAFKLLTKAVKNGESDIGAYIQLGNLLRERKMPEKALQIHRSLTVRRDLGYDEEKAVQIALAEDLSEMGKMDRAIGALNSIHKRKKDVDIARTLHRLYHRKGDYENAFSMLKAISNIDPATGPWERSAYLVCVGAILYDMNEKTESRAYLKKALKEDGSSVPALYLSAIVEADGGDSEAAVQMWHRLLVEDITFLEEILPDLQKALFESGDYERLELLLDDLSEKHPSDPLVNIALADLFLKKGDTRKSISVLREAKPSGGLADYLKVIKLAAAYLETGSEMDARKVLTEKRNFPNSRLAYICSSCGERSTTPQHYCRNCSSLNTFRTEE